MGEGPFTKSGVQPTPTELAIGCLIWRHEGRDNPISIAQIIAATGIRGLTPRDVKDVVEQLRLVHRLPIGALRDDPGGYFRIVDLADQEAAVGPYRKQILAMFRVLRVLDSPERVREFAGQLLLE